MMKIDIMYCSTDVRALADSIKAAEPIITEGVTDQLIETLKKLQSKVCDGNVKRYYKYKTLQTHLLPLTNIAFDKLGKRYLIIVLYRLNRLPNSLGSTYSKIA